MSPSAKPLKLGMLEPAYHGAYAAYKADPSPRNMSGMLTAADPLLKDGVKFYGSGITGPLGTGHAKRIFADAIDGYDPTKASLKSYMMSHFQGLQRVSGNLTDPVRAPERVKLDSAKLRQAEVELEEKLGRRANDTELADYTHMTVPRLAKARHWQPWMSEGQVETDRAGESGEPGSVAVQRNVPYDQYMELLYHDLDPHDRYILDARLGRNGRPVATVNEISAKLRITPGAVSQRSEKIRTRLDELVRSGLL